MLIKCWWIFTPGVNFTNIFCARFSYECLLSSYVVLRLYKKCDVRTKNARKKGLAPQKMLMNFSTWEWASFGWTSKQCHRQTWEKHRSNELSEFHSEKKISKVFFFVVQVFVLKSEGFYLEVCKTISVLLFY